MTTTEPPKYDVNDAFRDGFSFEDILRTCEEINPGDDALNVGSEPAETSVDAGPPEDVNLTDLGNARLLVRMAGRDLRWCGAMPGTGWMVWDRNRWRTDDTKHVVRQAMRVADTWRDMAPAPTETGAGDLVVSAEEESAAKRREALQKHAARCESAAAIKSMIELAGAHESVVTRRDLFDADPWLFNTLDRTYNLDTVTAYVPRRNDHITRLAGVGAVDAEAPLWMAFLRRIMGDDEAMVAFLQRAVGYCLTGSTAEQCMFIAYGRGANGKSTFMDTVAHIMGDYATSTPVETFTSRREGAIPNDLAALAGARLVSCSEAKEGGGLDEAIVKLATGGDPIVARFLNREFFSYLPAFKLWMLTNHKPVVRGTDEGIWRRLRMIPFTVTIPKEERDGDLPRKLKAEAPAILRWALDGLKEWRRIGLAPPTSVIEATQAYRDEMDILADFLEERCDRGPFLTSDNVPLYASYQEWAKDSGLQPKSHKWLTRALMDRGFEQDASRVAGRRWKGLGLRIVARTHQPRLAQHWGEA